MSKQTIEVNGFKIRMRNQNKSEDYVSITDLAKCVGEPVHLVRNWLRRRQTLRFMGIWESINNPNFIRLNYEELLYKSGENTFELIPGNWINHTNAIGLESHMVNEGGVFAHRDLALNFCYWLSPEFQLFLIEEFQRLKGDESKEIDFEWNVKRLMSKANYHIHTHAVRNHLIPPKLQNTKVEGMYMAGEADMINLALFGKTAKEWKKENIEAKGNMRDAASPEQLLVLSNLQSLNAKLLKWGCDKEQRLQILNESAIEEMSVLISVASMKKLKKKKRLAAKNK